MKNGTISITLMFLLISGISRGGIEQKEFDLQIYLPAEATIVGDTPNLGQVAIIKGDESLVTKANAITLGRIPSPSQKIIVDRPTILGRLACSEIESFGVTFTGAEEVTIEQRHQTIKSAEFVQKALDFLKNNSHNTSVCHFDPVRMPEDLVLPGINKDLKLSPYLVRDGSRNQAKVRIDVFSGDEEVAAREVVFRLKYKCRKIVAKIDIPQGTVLSPENIKFEETVSDTPESAGETVSYGCVAKRRIPANTVINSNMTGTAQPQVLLERNQNVVIKINTLGLSVTAIGKAMQQGRAGEYIKVQNLDSQRVIMAKVNEDGSVEPVF
jgi:flagella basal body P-ring formation protein FlgA